MTKFHKILEASRTAPVVAAVEAHFGCRWNAAEETFADFLSSLSATEARELAEDLGLVREAITAADNREAGHQQLRRNVRFHLTGGRG